MADAKAIVGAVVYGFKELAKDEEVVSLICGKYADGTPRNIRDAATGEYLSPKQKKKATSKKKKKKNTKFKL